ATVKKVQAVVKLQITAGKGKPSPPGGPALGQHGGDILEVCQGVNAQTQGGGRLGLPVVGDIYQDRVFSVVVEEAPGAGPLQAGGRDRQSVGGSSQGQDR